MTKEKLLKLEPGTLVDVTTDGVFCGTREWSHLTSEGCAFVRETYGSSCHLPWELSIHVPQPQVSGTIETKRKGLCDNTPEPHACCMEKDPLHNVAKCSCGASALLYPHLNNTVPAKVTSIDDEKLALHPKEETPPKLYTFRMGNATPATEEQIAEHECVKRLVHARDYWARVSREIADRLKESQNTERVLNEEVAKRNEQIHNLRLRVEQLEEPPTTDEVKHAYNALIAGGNRDEARVLQELSRAADRMADELEAKDGGRN